MTCEEKTCILCGRVVTNTDYEYCEECFRAGDDCD